MESVEIWPEGFDSSGSDIDVVMSVTMGKLFKLCPLSRSYDVDNNSYLRDFLKYLKNT